MELSVDRCEVCGLVGGPLAMTPYDAAMVEVLGFEPPPRWCCAGDAYADDGPLACADRHFRQVMARYADEHGGHLPSRHGQ